MFKVILRKSVICKKDLVNQGCMVVSWHVCDLWFSKYNGKPIVDFNKSRFLIPTAYLNFTKLSNCACYLFFTVFVHENKFTVHPYPNSSYQAAAKYAFPRENKIAILTK